MADKRVKFPPKRYDVNYTEPATDYKQYILKGKDKKGFSVRYINEEIGKGVFATQDFRQGDFLLEYSGERISLEEAKKREKEYPSKLGSFLFFFKDKRNNLCIDATFSKRKGRYMNDGFGGTQNAEVKVVKVGGKSHLAAFASRNIKSGEQVLFDYGVTSLPWRKPKGDGKEGWTGCTQEIQKDNSLFVVPLDSKGSVSAPNSVPSAPNFLTATQRNSVVILSWDAPVDNGGLLVQGYTIVKKTFDKCQLLARVKSNIKSYSVTDLEQGMPSRFAVNAHNAVGTGPSAEVKCCVEVQDNSHGFPEAPQYLTVQPGYDKVLLSWDAPKNDGGFRIEGYCVMMKVSNSNWCQLAWVKEENRHYTVENLQQSKPYRFCVIAENVIGRGPYVEIKSDVYLKSLADLSEGEEEVEQIYISYGATMNDFHKNKHIDELRDQHCHQHLNRNHQNGTSAHDSPRKEEGDQLQKLPIVDEEGAPQYSQGSGRSSGSVNNKLRDHHCHQHLNRNHQNGTSAHDSPRKEEADQLQKLPIVDEEGAPQDSQGSGRSSGSVNNELRDQHCHQHLNRNHQNGTSAHDSPRKEEADQLQKLPTVDEEGALQDSHGSGCSSGSVHNLSEGEEEVEQIYISYGATVNDFHRNKHIDELRDQHCHQHLNRNHQNGTSAHDSPRKEEGDQLQKLPIVDEEGAPQDSQGSGRSSGSVNNELSDQHCHQHLNRNHQNGTSAHDSPRKEEADQLQKLPTVDEEGALQDSHGSGSSLGSVNNKLWDHHCHQHLNRNHQNGTSAHDSPRKEEADQLRKLPIVDEEGAPQDSHGSESSSGSVSNNLEEGVVELIRTPQVNKMCERAQIVSSEDTMPVIQMNTPTSSFMFKDTCQSGNNEDVTASGSLLEQLHIHSNLTDAEVEYLISLFSAVDKDQETLEMAERENIIKNRKYLSDVLFSSVSVERLNQVQQIDTAYGPHCLQGQTNYCGYCCMANSFVNTSIKEMDILADRLWLQMADNPSLGLRADLEPMRDSEGFYSVEVINATVENHNFELNKIDERTLLGLSALEIGECVLSNLEEQVGMVSLIIRKQSHQHWICINVHDLMPILKDSQMPSPVPLTTEQFGNIIKNNMESPGAVFFLSGGKPETLQKQVYEVQVLEKKECGAQNAYEALLAKTVSPTRRSTKSNTGEKQDQHPTRNSEVTSSNDSSRKEGLNQLQEIPIVDDNSAQQESNDNECSSGSINNKQSKKMMSSKKPYRPCPYCHVFKSALSNHLQRKHKDEEAVKRALSLPRQQKIRCLANLKKDGIMKANMQILKKGKKEKGKLIRERKPKSAESKLVYCSECHAFLSSKYFFNHKRLCMSNTFTGSVPQCMPTNLHCDTSNDQDYRKEILRSFHQDEVGKICISDELIIGFGHREYKTIRNHKNKKQEKRSAIKAKMRRLGVLYHCFKQKCHKAKVETTSAIDMLKRKNFNLLEDTIYTLTADDEGEMKKNGLKVGYGYIIIKVSKYLHGEYLVQEKDEDAAEIDRFLTVFRFHWGAMFSDAETANAMKRHENLRKPQNLPSEKDIKSLRDFTVKKIKALTDDQYLFMANSEYTLLRDLVVSRLTLFNARRGGEPCSLVLQEWKDALNDVWYHNVEEVDDPLEKMLIGRYKLAYQIGKRTKLVPVLIIDDCWKAVEILTDPEVRKQAGVLSENVYIFPSTRLSTCHVSGWNATENCCEMAQLGESITATQMRHYASTVYAGLEVSDADRRRFYDHMGHTESMNKDVYQSPLAIKEVTQVGRFLDQLDRGEIGKKTSSQQPNINTNNKRSMPNHGSSRKEVANQPQEIQEHDLQDSHGNAASSGEILNRNCTEHPKRNDENSTSSHAISRKEGPNQMQEIHVNNEEHALQDSHDNRCSVNSEIQEKRCNQCQTKTNENSTSDHASSREERPSQQQGPPMVDEECALLEFHGNQSSSGSIISEIQEKRCNQCQTNENSTSDHASSREERPSQLQGPPMVDEECALLDSHGNQSSSGSIISEIQEKRCNQCQTKTNENSTSDHASSREERPSQLQGPPMVDEECALLDSHGNQSSSGSIISEIQEKRCNQCQTKTNENSTSDHASSREERPSQLQGPPMVDEECALQYSHGNQSSPGSINKKRIYRPWTSEDTEVIHEYFKEYIEDTTDIQTNKGALPGVEIVKEFIRQHPEILPDESAKNKISRIKTKVFNDRKELRRKLGNLDGEKSDERFK